MFGKKLFAGIILTEDFGTLRNAATIAVITGLVAFYFSLFLPISTRAAHYAFIVFIFLPTLAAIRCRDLRVPLANVEVGGICLLLLYLLASRCWSFEFSHEQSQHFLMRSAYLYTLVIAMYIFVSRVETCHNCAYWLIGGTALCVAASLIHFYSSHALIQRFEAYGRFTNSNSIGILCAAMCVIALTRYSSESWFKQVFFGAVSLLFLAGVVLSHSRSGLMALVTTCVFIAMRLRRWRVAAMALIAILLASAALGFSIWTERGLSFRDGIWSIDWSRLQHCGVTFGCGISTSSGAMINDIMIYHIHSIPFGMLFYGGLVGLALYMSLISLSLYRGWTQPELSDACILLLAGCTGTLVESHEIITAADPIWVYLIAPLIFLALHRQRYARNEIDHSPSL